MIQTIMFDMKGQPTELAMRYVVPKYYTVKYKGHGVATRDVHAAIGFWLKNIDSVIETHW
jgi:hypothetical protein